MNNFKGNLTMNTKNTWKLNEGHPPLDWNETVEVQFYDGSTRVDKVNNIDWVNTAKLSDVYSWREVTAKDNEGWIENTGVKPVEDDVIVDVLLNNGTINTRSSGKLAWDFSHRFSKTNPYDIKEWKLAKPEKSQQDSEDKSENTFESESREEQTKFDLYTTELSISAKEYNPIFGELVTKVRLQDEASGMFLEVIQEGNATNKYKQQVIHLEFQEFKKLIEAVNILEDNAKRFEKSK